MVGVNSLKTPAIELWFNKIFRLEPDMIGTSDGNMPCFRATYFDYDCGHEKVICIKADFKAM